MKGGGGQLGHSDGDHHGHCPWGRGSTLSMGLGLWPTPSLGRDQHQDAMEEKDLLPDISPQEDMEVP